MEFYRREVSGASLTSQGSSWMSCLHQCGSKPPVLFEKQNPFLVELLSL